MYKNAWPKGAAANFFPYEIKVEFKAMAKAAGYIESAIRALIPANRISNKGEL